MTGRPEAPASTGGSRGVSDGAFRLTVLLIAVFLIAIAAKGVAGLTESDPGGQGAGAWGTTIGSSSEPSASASPPDGIDVEGYLDPAPVPASALELTGADGAPLSLAGMRGGPVLVFFGYTHCPDICPTTIGVVGEAIAAADIGARAVFVSVDPERDTVAFLSKYVRYMPAGTTAATGTAAQIRETADAWGVRYARVEEADPAEYSMAHTADVFVIDGTGRLRGRLPFGTDSPTMAEVLRRVAAATPIPTVAPTPIPDATPIPTATPTPTTAAVPTATAASPSMPPAASTFWPVLVSSAVWSGGHSPVILKLERLDGRIDDPGLAVAIQLLADNTTPVGRAVPAMTVQQDGRGSVYYIATMDIPTPGQWTAVITGVDRAGTRWAGRMGMMVRDQGETPALGDAAPAMRTPVAADYGGDASWVTTDPVPDPRLSNTSTADSLTAGRPFVLIIDSYRFKVSRGCGTALFMSRGLLDRWAGVDFIHHEPFRYTVVASEPVLDGTLADPKLTSAAKAWGVGGSAWGIASMPWLYVVDGHGIVRAKYQGVVGTADVETILAMIAQEP